MLKPSCGSRAVGFFPLTLLAPWELRLSLRGWAQVSAASCALGRAESQRERWPSLQEGLTCHGAVPSTARRGWWRSVGRQDGDTVPELLCVARAPAGAQPLCPSHGVEMGWRKQTWPCCGGREMLTERIIRCCRRELCRAPGCHPVLAGQRGCRAGEGSVLRPAPQPGVAVAAGCPERTARNILVFDALFSVFPLENTTLGKQPPTSVAGGSRRVLLWGRGAVSCCPALSAHRPKQEQQRGL